ncbi:MAG TPA: hypothetical protein VG106_13595, partial [Vicinamibacterales bacterium]|nr:hypothetical protein [Vicinamibacterales bacterium]
MDFSSGWRVLIAVVALMPGVEAAQSQSGVRHAAERRDTAAPTRLANVFRSSTPCDAPVRRLLDIPPAADAHLMEWKLTLDEPRSPGGSAHYQLMVRYGVTAAGHPGLAPRPATLERQGTWTS